MKIKKEEENKEESNKDEKFNFVYILSIIAEGNLDSFIKTIKYLKFDIKKLYVNINFIINIKKLG
jgi:hypothetical protein